MGEVFQAHDGSLDRTVAVKWLRAGRQHHSDAMARFVAEARISGRLEHPGVVPIYELGVDASGRVFYTMRQVKGITLAVILTGLHQGQAEMAEKYPLSALLVIFQKICDTIAYAHSLHIIHRDLKPENIMIGAFGEVFVLDWGLAKEHNSDESTVALPGNPRQMEHPGIHARFAQTMDGAVLGSIGYMAPEHAAGRSHESDERSDIFSLGAILYNILTLRPPIHGADRNSILRRTEAAEIRPPSDYNWPERMRRGDEKPQTLGHCPNGRIPNALSSVAMKALASHPDDRYQKVNEMQSDITAYQTGYAPTAEKAGLLTHLLLLVRRNKSEFSLIAVAFVIIVALTAGFLIRVTSTLRELQATAPSFAAEAIVLVEQGKLEQALEKIRYAQKLMPAMAEYRQREGNILQALLRLQDARDAYAASLKLAPGDGLAARNIALCDELLAANKTNGSLSADLMERLRTNLLEQSRVTEALAVAKHLEARDEVSVERWRQHLQRGGFPGKLTRVTDGGLELDASRCAVTNLIALKGMPLARLNLSFTSISDLEPLRGMPLKWLNVQHTQVEDLGPLAGMPLEDLIISGSKVADLSPLKGMALLHLLALDLPVKDLTPLKGMPLRYLNLYGCRDVTDIRPLEGMHLNWLDLYHSRVSDLTPLRNMPLNGLNLEVTQVSDLSPLQRVPLVYLALLATPVTDLSPLKGMLLTNLTLSGTQITDLRPIEGMPLKELLLHGCNQVRDLTALGACHDLERLTIPATAEKIEFLRDLPKLRKLSYSISNSRNWDIVSSVVEFWQEYDGRSTTNP